MSRNEGSNDAPREAGWPDVSALERMVNELFAARPGPVPVEPGSPPPAAGVAGHDPVSLGPAAPVASDLVPDVPLMRTGPIAVGHDADAELRDLQSAFSASMWTTPAQSQVSLAGGLLLPSFYFLDHATAPSGVPSASPHAVGVPPVLDVPQVRRDFPILQERVNGRPLVWLDNAATTQKPRVVIDRVSDFYRHENSNIHRAAHELAARATDAYEAGRETARRFLGARSTNEIVFVRGATEAINLVAQSWGRSHLNDGDEIVVSWLEHHANIVPWQQIAQERGARLRVIPVDDDGQIVLEEYGRLLGPRTKIVSVTHVSNALGTITPVSQIVQMAHAAGARVLIDGAQAVSHLPVDVQAIGADWYVFSGHKVFGPTGIGVLYGRESLLNAMPPWQGGGNMIRDVTFERTEYQASPARFEAGTGNIADVAGLDAALDYVLRLGRDAISQYEHQLLAYATRLLKDVPGLRLLGTAPDKASVLSFVIEGHRTEDIGRALNREGIAVRSGHHCAQPILRRLGVETSVRPSLAFYNTCEEIDRLVTQLTRLATRRATVVVPPAFRA